MLLVIAPRSDIQRDHVVARLAAAPRIQHGIVRPDSGSIWALLSALLFLSGGTTNPFVSLYLPSLAIAAAVLPWHLMAWLAGVCRGLLRGPRVSIPCR